MDERVEGAQKDAFLIETHRTGEYAFDRLPDTVYGLVEGLYNTTGSRRRGRRHVGVHVPRMLCI